MILKKWCIETDHIESEMKFLIKNFDENLLKKRFKSKDIKQYYLPLNPEVKTMIEKTFNNNIKFIIGEARVRVINQKNCILTIKSDGDTHRNEMEKEIPISLAKYYIFHSTKSVHKTRYTLHKTNEKLVEMDFYRDRDLCVMEIEFDRNQENEQKIENFARKFLNSKAKVQNVTNDKTFKNKNLAK